MCITGYKPVSTKTLAHRKKTILLRRCLKTNKVKIVQLIFVYFFLMGPHHTFFCCLANLPCFSCLLSVLFHQVFRWVDLSLITFDCVFQNLKFLQSNLVERFTENVCLTIQHRKRGKKAVYYCTICLTIPTFFCDIASSSSNSTFLTSCKLLLSFFSLSCNCD